MSHGGVGGDVVILIGRTLEERRQHHHSVGTAIGGAAGAGDHVLNHRA